mgnify:CR=1 FL=1
MPCASIISKILKLRLRIAKHWNKLKSLLVFHPSCMSQSNSSQSSLSSYEFIAEMKKCLSQGQRFTPFFGSGISAQSGIMMGREFPDYIAYTVYRVLGGRPIGADESSEVLAEREPHWDIRARGWPAYPNSTEIDDAYEFIYRLYQHLECERCDVIPKDIHAKRKEVTAVLPKNASSSGHGINTGDADLFRALVPGILRSAKFDEEETRLDAKRRHLKIKDEISDPNIPSSSRSYIDSAAIRSLSHWTRTLEFLCRVAVNPGKTSRLYLDDPDIAVIDSFNAYITRGKRPNLIHNMVARLSRSLRSQVLLTTNFDTLIEESYRAQGEPLHVLAVSIKGGLPSFATVRAQDCLIKLHGDILETRADSTINDPPTERDKDIFFQYLRGPNEPAKHQPKDFSQSHLLVLGYSGNDARCVQMIRNVLDLDPEFRVFWVCHGERDRERISKIFADYLTPRKTSNLSQEGPQFIIYQTDRSDLFLWELYQQINLSLPGGGYSVQFNHFVPPISNDDETKNQSQAFRDQIKEYCDEIEKVTKKAVAVVDSPSGAARPMQACFYRLRSQWNEAAWIELEDYRNTDDLFFNLLSIISQRIGQFQLEWTNFAPSYDRDIEHDFAEGKETESRRFNETHMQRRLELLIEKFKIDPERWYLFLYGRNGPGGCSGWSENGKPEYWREEEYGQQFTQLLVWLRKLKFRVIYMPHGKDRAEHGDAKIKELVKVARSHPLFAAITIDTNDYITKLKAPRAGDLVALPTKSLPTFPSGMDKRATGKKFKDMISLVLRDFFPDPKNANDTIRATRSIWLYGLTLIRQSRHPSMLISEAVFPCPWKYQKNNFDVWENPDRIVGSNLTDILRDNDELRFWLVFQQASPPNKEIEGITDALDDVDFNGWMNTLVDHGLFLRKPGGYSWMYRDARLGLQKLYEQIENLQFSRELFPKGDECPLTAAGGFKGLRPGMHFWIGEWYLRAFYATGHYMPLVEAIYHSVQCLEYISQYEKPRRISKREKTDDEKRQQRLALAWMALCQLRKLLCVGRKSFLFWCPGVDIVTVFFRRDFERVIDSWKKNTAIQPSTREWHNRFVESCDALKQEVAHLRAAVEAEGYAHGGRSSPVMTASPASAVSAKLHAPIHHGSGDIGLRGREWYASVITKMKEVLDGYGDKPAAIKLLCENSPFDIPWDFDNQDDDDEKNPTILHARLRDDLLRYFLNSSGKETSGKTSVYEFAWLISELMYRIARRAKIRFHSDETTHNKIVPDHWRTVCALGYTGLSLCRNLPPEFHEADCDLRVRILTVYAVALGYLNRFSESARRFNEAHALIISGMETTSGRELARIHIRRAEMLIWRAKWKMGILDTPDTPNKLLSDYHLVVTHIDEAWTALERGELGLGGNSHSTYWWHRLLALKLSCYATLGKLRENLTKPRSTNCDREQMAKLTCVEDGDFFEHCLPFRRRLHLPSTLMSLARDALVVGAGDDFRKLRIIDYLLDADKLISDANSKFFGDNDEVGLLFSKARGCEALIEDIVRVFYDDDQLGILPSDAGGSKLPALRNQTGDLQDSLGKYTKRLWDILEKNHPKACEKLKEFRRNMSRPEKQPAK